MRVAVAMTSGSGSGVTQLPPNAYASGAPGAPPGSTPKNGGGSKSVSPPNAALNDPARVSRPNVVVGPAPRPRSPGSTSTTLGGVAGEMRIRLSSPLPKMATGAPPVVRNASRSGCRSLGHDHVNSDENPSATTIPGPDGRSTARAAATSPISARSTWGAPPRLLTRCRPRPGSGPGPVSRTSSPGRPSVSPTSRMAVQQLATNGIENPVRAKRSPFQRRRLTSRMSPSLSLSGPSVTSSSSVPSPSTSTGTNSTPIRCGSATSRRSIRPRSADRQLPDREAALDVLVGLGAHGRQQDDIAPVALDDDQPRRLG